MGRIKSKIIKKTAAQLAEQEPAFTTDFEINKKILKNAFFSKKVRNRVAGHIVRLKKQPKLTK